MLAAGRRFGAQSDGPGSELFAFATSTNEDFVNRDFGVTARQSADSGLSETDLDGGFRSLGLQYLDRRFWSTSWQTLIQIGYEQYSDEIGDSPIAREDVEAELGVSMLYPF